MKRGENYGGGQSSLGYLFGSPNDPSNPNDKPPPPPPTLVPPYGTDKLVDDSPSPRKTLSPDPDPDQGSSNPKVERGNSLGNFIMARPTTKVKSAPGGSSSLGYLFGDK